MKILVMGAGYVGMALLTFLQDLDHEVYLTTTEENRVEALKPYGKGVLLLRSNHDQELWDLMDLCDAMIVLIAPKNSQNYQTTYLNTAQRISLGLTNRKRPFSLLYTSSTSVYEEASSDLVTEDTSVNPPSENGKILLETERCYLNSKASTCILRLGGIYGPKRALEERAKRFSGKEMTGTGNEATNHIHLEDIVRGILFCLEYSLTGTYNLVNDDHPKRKKLYCDLCHLTNLPLPIWNPDICISTKGGYIVSNTKIKEAGFVFRHPRLFD